MREPESKWGQPSPRVLQFLKQMKRELPKGSWILDAGCGDGRHTLPFAAAGFKVHAVDVNKKDVNTLLKRARRARLSRNIEAEAGDFRKIKFKRKYDAVLCSGTLHYLEEKEAKGAVEKLKELTKAKGFNFISAQMKHPKVITSPGRKFFRKGELKRMYSDWETLSYEEGPLRLDAGHAFLKDMRFRKPHFHKFARLIARKK